MIRDALIDGPARQPVRAQEAAPDTQQTDNRREAVNRGRFLRASLLVGLVVLGACAGGAVLWWRLSAGPPDAKGPVPPSPPSPPPAPLSLAQRYLGSYCNAIDGSGCNPSQLPMYESTSYLPDLMLQITDAEVAVEEHETISESTSVRYKHQVSEYMNIVRNSFGLGGSGILNTIAFSLHFGHSDLVTHMGLSDTRSFYAEMSRTYTVFSAELRSQIGSGELPFKYQPTFARDVSQLPDGAPNGTALKTWFCFFDRWGTHYVKRVDFGGACKMRTFIDEQATYDSKTKDSNWNVNLDAMFRVEAGLPFNFSAGAAGEQQSESYHAFLNYAKGKYFYSLGGDYSKEKGYHEWLGTVKEKPAPISTTLRPLSDILPISKQFNAAYAAYLSRCPSTTEGGVCNGLGSCTSCEQEQAYCTCNAGAYLEDSVCYPDCPGDPEACNGKGDCHRGKCKCHALGDGPFSYKGAACDTKCGSLVYNAKPWHCLGIPESGNCLAGVEAMKNNGSCFCQKNTGIYDDDMHATHHLFDVDVTASADSFQCINPDTKVCTWVPPFQSCVLLNSVTCQFGKEKSSKSCSEDTTVHVATDADFKAFASVMKTPLHYPTALNLAGADCVDFRKNAIPCDELEKARVFNRRLNEGTIATQSRSYDWVRAAMTQDGLPGERWHVGHMCPGGGKPKTWPGNKARNLIAQTAKDNAGPGGLQSKQMTAAEAAFYSRTLTTCADLPPMEEPL